MLIIFHNVLIFHELFNKCQNTLTLIYLLNCFVQTSVLIKLSVTCKLPFVAVPSVFVYLQVKVSFISAAFHDNTELNICIPVFLLQGSPEGGGVRPSTTPSKSSQSGLVSVLLVELNAGEALRHVLKYCT